MAMEEKLKELKARLREVDDLQSTVALMNWDQSTYMPPAGAKARGRQMATLSRLAQEKFTDATVGQLLDDLEPYAAELPDDSDDASLIRVTRRDYERAVKVPPSFTAEFYEHTAVAYNVWAEARPANDFEKAEPYLQKNLELSRRLANFFPGYEHIADPLIAYQDYGMQVSTIRPLFAELRQALVPLVETITGQQEIEDDFLHRSFPEKDQLAFGKRVIKRYGYDFERGRQDKTHHPFMTKFSLDDVRITTRVQEHNLNEALFSTLHEAGHALYELGIDPAFEATPLASGTSAAVHESQSRLWENQVGRSLPFWHHFYPQLQDLFSNQLQDVSLEQFYRAVNKVQRSLIRTDADEVTYNLHVMIRFDLELQLLEGELAVADLPEAWHERYQRDLGVRAADDRNGVMQDVHWFAGTVGGAFQGYTLGNVLAALFYASALEAHPEISEEMEQGTFETLHGWLRENIYRHGSKFTTSELVQRVTSGPVSIEPYLDYLRDKFGDLYALNG